MSDIAATNRYGALVIAIHWLTALLIVLMFATGWQASGQADDGAKVALLRVHVPLGIAIFLLTAFRVVWWVLVESNRSMPADGAAWRRFLARCVHIGLYLVIFAMAGTGIGTIVLSGALPAIIGGTALPNLETIAPRNGHEVAARILMLLLFVHIGAALYHQFILRDRLLARMGLGRRI